MRGPKRAEASRRVMAKAGHFGFQRRRAAWKRKVVVPMASGAQSVWGRARKMAESRPTKELVVS